ncbi:MAG: FxLYD domain-containing protein [Polyangiaceae bacterium]
MKKKFFSLRPALVVFGIFPFAVGCGAGGSSDVSGAGAPGTSGAVGVAGASTTGGAGGSSGDTAVNVSGGSVTVADDGKPFVPADTKYSLVDGGRALTLLSATVINDSTGLSWFIAVRNDETVPICLPQVNAAFTDATDPNSLGGQAVVLIEGPMYQSDAGTHPCLMPGVVGMGWQGVSGFTSAMPKIGEIDYQPRGYPSPEATKLPDLAVEGIMITNDPTGGKHVTGNVTNHGTNSAARPEVNIFAVDSGGRPFDAGYANSMTDLAPGSSWTFEMTVPTPFNKFIAFPVWGQQ